MCRVRRDAHAATSLLRSRKPARKRFSKSRFVPSVSIVIGGRVFQKRSGLSKSAENFKSLASTSSATSAFGRQIRYLARFLAKWNEPRRENALLSIVERVA